MPPKNREHSAFTRAFRAGEFKVGSINNRYLAVRTKEAAEPFIIILTTSSHLIYSVVYTFYDFFMRHNKKQSLFMMEDIGC